MRAELEDVPVVILCGGMGTRLREETEYRPKPMVEIGGRPIFPVPSVRILSKVGREAI
jgi:glucose-1-phosphate cytidylyltransferase